MGRTARDDIGDGDGDGEVEKPGHAREFDASERSVECAPDRARSARHLSKARIIDECPHCCRDPSMSLQYPL
jgi:hypothetical protein